jgi:hypothetical protein
MSLTGREPGTEAARSGGLFVAQVTGAPNGWQNILQAAIATAKEQARAEEAALGQTALDIMATAVDQRVEQARREEAEKWATGFCSAHQVPDAACRICNVALQLTDRLADARRECRAEIVAMLDRLVAQYSTVEPYYGADALRLAVQQIQAADQLAAPEPVP